MADFRISTKVARHSESSAQYAYATHGRRRQSMSAGATSHIINTDIHNIYIYARFQLPPVVNTQFDRIRHSERSEESVTTDYGQIDSSLRSE